MALIDEVPNYLVAQGIAAAGSTANNYVVSKGYVPNSPDKLIAILETGGLPNEGLSTGTVDRPTFQVRVRSGAYGYSTARAKLESVRSTLEGVINKKIGSPAWGYLHIKAMHPALSLGQDDQDRPTVVMNFWALRSRTS